MSRLHFVYKVYDWKFPKEISEADYLYLRDHVDETRFKKIFSLKVNIVKEFWWELILIVMGIIAVLLLKYQIVPSLEYLYIIFLISGLASLASFIVSLYNFIENHIEQVSYFKLLRLSIKKSSNYYEFCKLMSDRDFRYGRKCK